MDGHVHFWYRASSAIACPILNVISAYLVTMDTMANALIGESDPEESQKIQDRIEALTSH